MIKSILELNSNERISALEFIKNNKNTNLSLSEIEKNSIAYEICKKRGFKVYNKISNWIEIL